MRPRPWGLSGRLMTRKPNASYYLQGRGYTEDDVEAAVSEAAGTDLHAWFVHCVGGTDDVDFDTVLAGAGLVWAAVRALR